MTSVLRSRGYGSLNSDEMTAGNLDINPPSPKAKMDLPQIRNLVAFWFFGLCNNFAYVIMLSAAHDILKEEEGEDSNSTTTANVTCNTTERVCNTLSTGAVLLADIIPTLVIKLTAPFFMEHIPYGIRNFLVVLFQAGSYLIVSFSVSVPMSLFGVVCASIGAGLGEIMFLSFSSYFDKNVISTWSSGTGGAGLFGSLAYAGITQAGMNPRNTVLVMLVIPVIMAFSYWVLLVFPESVHRVDILRPSTWLVPYRKGDAVAVERPASVDLAGMQRPEFDSSSALIIKEEISLQQKFRLVVPLLKFMIPLGCVYIGEYFINQGLHELIYFCRIQDQISKEAQYRWYQVTYQLGVFISRSSVNLIQIKTIFLPILAILQFVNVALLFCEAYYLFMPSIWIVLALILYEGLLGGAAYVNTFYRIRQEVLQKYVEFSLGVASVADSTGIVIAGLSSIPAHNWICTQSLPFFHY